MFAPLKVVAFPEDVTKSMSELRIVLYNSGEWMSVPKLRLHISAPFFSADFIAWMTLLIFPPPILYCEDNAFNDIIFKSRNDAIPSIP